MGLYAQRSGQSRPLAEFDFTPEPSVQEAEDTAVVLAGRCRNSAPVVPAVMIVAVGRAGSAAPPR